MNITVFLNYKKEILPVERVKSMLANEMISPSSLGLIEGQTEWLPLWQIPQLQIVSSASIPTPQQSQQSRKVGFWLGAGILFLPYIFSWFTLRNGYSVTARTVAFVWLGVVGIGVMLAPEQPKSAVSSNTATVAKTQNERLYPVRAETLESAYSKNEVSANRLYQGNSYVVTGEVESINESVWGNPYVVLKDEDSNYTNIMINLKSSERSAASKLSKGQTVYIKATCTGMSLGTVTMSDGEIK